MPGTAADKSVLMRILDVMAQSDQDALELIDDAMSRWPADGRLPFLRGAILAGLDQRAPARSEFARSVALTPELHIAWFMLGLLHIESGDVNAALESWKPLANRDDDDVLRMFASGLLQLVADDLEGAAVTLETARALNREYSGINRYVDEVVARIAASLSANTAGTTSGDTRHYLMGGYLSSSTRH